MASLAHELRRSLQGEPRVIYNVRPDLCPAIARAIELRESSESFPSLNVGGWKSTEGFFNWIDPAVVELAAEIRRHMNVSRIVGWAMVNRNGSYHPSHDHAGAIVSAIYCVDPGEPPGAPTIFEHLILGDITVTHNVGQLVIFPSLLKHRMPPYQGARSRLTVALDCRIE